MPYGTLKVDNIIFTNGGVDQTITVSGIVASTSGNLTATGTISGNIIRGGTTVSGATVTGSAGQFGNLTAVSGTFTTQLSGVTVTGTTANFTSGNFNNISGGTHTITSGVFAAGTATNPSISFTSDPNTGIYRPAADEIGFTTNGQVKLVIDVDGQLEANAIGSESLPTYTFSSDSDTGIYSPGANQLAISTNGSGRLFVDASGNVGIGTAPAAGSRLHINSATSTDCKQQISVTTGTQATYTAYVNTTVSTIGTENSTGGSLAIGSGPYATVISNGGAYPVQFGTNNTIRATIDSSGRFLVGTSTAVLARASIQGVTGNSTYTAEGLTVAVGGNTVNPNGRGVVADFSAGGASDPATTYGATINLGASSIGQWGLCVIPGASFAISDYYPGGAYVGAANPPIARMTIDSSGRVGIGTTSARQRLTLGDTTATSTATPECIDLGATYSSTAGANMKILTYNDGTLKHGIGVSVASSDYLTTPTGSHVFYRGTSEVARFDSSSRLLVGTSSARSTSTVVWRSQIEGAGEFTGLGITTNQDGTGGAYLSLAKSRGTVLGSNTIVQNGDGLGYILFSGADGTDANTQAAFIGCEVDGTPGANDMPGRLVFYTTADGASSPTERMRIDSTGVARFTAGPEAPAYRIRRSIGGTPRNVGAFDYDPQTDGSTQGLVVVICQGNDSAGAGGVSLSRGATSWASYSDERAKTDLVPIDDGLTKVSTLRAITGRYIDDEPGTSRSFLIAQDVQSVLPEAVDAGDQDKLNLRYTEVIPLLVAALKESKERIEALEQRLTDAGIA